MIPPPKLDDRGFHDIVEEAISMIPRYSPEWTNHNPSDPGITLIELAAWMTDLLVQRLNQVPELNYVAFLNLLGIAQRPPRAAKAVLRFTLTEGATKQRVPTGTQVSTSEAGEESSVTFETAHDLVVSIARPDRCFSYFDNSYSENTSFIDPEVAPGGASSSRPIAQAALGDQPGDSFEIFHGAQRIERYIYLSDPRFANAGEASVLRVFLGMPERGGRDMARLLEWEHWDGTRWKDLRPAHVEVDRGEVPFAGPIQFAPTSVNHIEGLWLRGRLAEVPASPEDTEIDTIRTKVEVIGEGLMPSHAYANLDGTAFIQLDLSKTLYPFGKEPKIDHILYLACDELMQTADSYVSFELSLADSAVIPAPNPSEQLVLAWEFFDGKRWRRIGRSSRSGALAGTGEEFGFHDETKALSKSGVVSFRRPKDMEPSEINGVAKHWVRVRIDRGDYGEPGQYTLDNERWIFKDDRPLRPPALRSIAVRYREDYRDVRHVLTFNDFQYTDVTEVARTAYTIFQPFVAQPEESPAMFLGFTSKPENHRIGLYFQLEEELGLGAVPSDEAEVVTAELEKYETLRKLVWEGGQRVVWEYWDGRSWEALTVDDETQNFTASGFCGFIAPETWEKSSKFMEDRWWLRARLEHGGYVKSPRIKVILSNAIDAYHQRSIVSETLGSSAGTPLQAFRVLRGPLLDGETLEVLERKTPDEEELAELGPNAVLKADPDDPDSSPVWVRWQRVDSFYASTPRSRHYTLDYVTGIVSFGDGRKGLVPPEALNSIVISYRIGGGELGNVNTNTLTSLYTALAHIRTVTNPMPTAGGSDRETIEEAKDRAPYTIKSRDRAVTGEDYEMLALRASTQLARARCLPDRSNRGQVILVVLPKADLRGAGLAQRLVPSHEVQRHVKHFLQERQLIGTILQVVRPSYKDMSLRVVLSRRSVATSDRLRKEVELKLRRFFHALVGGRDGKGWEFGRPVLKTEIVHLVEEVPGVEGVDHVEIRDEDRGITVEHLRVDDDELPFLVHVQLAERVRDDIK